MMMTHAWLLSMVAILTLLPATQLFATETGERGTGIPLYERDFTRVAENSLPDDFMVIQGEFEVKAVGTNKLLELPGAPLDGHSLLFGPATNANVMVEARILSSAKGRRMPSFGIGMGGVAGYKLQVAPAKDAIELLLDTQVVTNATFKWKSGQWTHCQLRILSLPKEKAWTIEARAWNEGEPEPRQWTLSVKATEPPIFGQASILGSPFSGNPIQYDDLRVSPTTGPAN